MARHLPVSQVQAAMDAAPLVPETAAHLGLVDGAKYRDQVWDLFPVTPAGHTQGEGEGGKEGGGKVQRMRRVPLSRYMAIQRIQQAAEVTGSEGGWSLGGLWARLRGWEGRGESEGREARAERETDGKVQGESCDAAGGGTADAGGADTKTRGGSRAGGVKGRVAVVVLKGAIVQGPVQPGSVPPQQELIDAVKVAAQLEKLERDDKVRGMRGDERQRGRRKSWGRGEGSRGRERDGERGRGLGGKGQKLIDAVKVAAQLEKLERDDNVRGGRKATGVKRGRERGWRG